MYTSLSELRHGDGRRINLPRTPVDNERLGSNMQTLKLRFRALLGDGIPEVYLERT